MKALKYSIKVGTSKIMSRVWPLCVTLPLTKGPTGLPVGIQLVGRQHEDASLLDIAAWARSVLS